MSRLINTSFECSLCKAHSPVSVEKPGPYSVKVKWCECKGCKSKFQLRFQKITGTTLRVSYQSLKIIPTEAGYEEYKKRTFKPPKELPLQAAINSMAQTEGEKS